MYAYAYLAVSSYRVRSAEETTQSHRLSAAVKWAATLMHRHDARNKLKVVSNGLKF